MKRKEIAAATALLTMLLLAAGSAKAQGNSIVWVDAEGTVIGPKVEGALFIDADYGLQWQIDTDTATLLPPGWITVFYSNTDCTGAERLQGPTPFAIRQVFRVTGYPSTLFWVEADNFQQPRPTGPNFYAGSQRTGPTGMCYCYGPRCERTTPIYGMPLNMFLSWEGSIPQLNAVAPLHLERR